MNSFHSTFAQVPEVDLGQPFLSTAEDVNTYRLAPEEAVLVQIVRLLRAQRRAFSPVDQAFLEGARVILARLLELCSDSAAASSQEKVEPLPAPHDATALDVAAPTSKSKRERRG